MRICSRWRGGSSWTRRRWRRRFGERTFRERVLEDVAGGRRAGVHGTPTFFVDGERLEGPWRQLAQIVPAKLEKTKH